MAHAQKPDFVLRLNGQVRLNRRGSQFSRLLAAEVCASALVMLETPRSEAVWEYWLPTPFPSFPFTSPPVRHRVPPHSERSILTKETARNIQQQYTDNLRSYKLTHKATNRKYSAVTQHLDTRSGLYSERCILSTIQREQCACFLPTADIGAQLLWPYGPGSYY